MTDKQQAYLEFYFALDVSTLAFGKGEAGKYSGALEVAVSLSQDSMILAADKFRMSTPAVQDTNELRQVYLQQQRFLLEPGTYQLHIQLHNIYGNSKPVVVEQAIEVREIDSSAHASDLLFLDSYKPSETGSSFSKSGFDLIPYVSSSSYFFDDNHQKLAFYLELYNIHQTIDPGEAYVLKYFIEDDNTGQPLGKFASFSKKQATVIQPVLAEFNIRELQTGNYNIVIQSLDREGEI